MSQIPTFTTLDFNLNTLEKGKFALDSEGEVVIRTFAKASGLNTGGKITEVTINDSSWTALPTTALSGRNALSIQNLSGGEIKINYDNTVGTYTGIVIQNGAERYYDVGETIIIYAKSLSGNRTINIEELA